MAGINIQQITDLIAQQPGIRTVEVAERLDCDVAHVLPALEGYIETRVIIATPIKAPNGSMIAELHFADDLKKPKAQKAAQPQPEPEKVSTVKNKAQIALEALAVRPLSTARLKHVMGITGHPSEYLRPEIKDGLVKNNHGLWALQEPKTDTKTESPDQVTVTGAMVIKSPAGKHQVRIAIPPGDPRVVGAEPAPADEPNPNRAPCEAVEMVDHPAHYNKSPSGIECIDVIEHMSFNVGNAVKYCWRADAKGAALEDLKKAVWYLNREIAKREKKATA